MANAVVRIREVFKAKQKPLTLADIAIELPDLKANQISMAMCYFRKQRYASREQIKSEKAKGRKQVWLYTLHNAKLPKPVVAVNV